MNRIDHFLGRITMYRLMVYYLRVLVGAAIVFSFLGLLPYRSGDILLSAAYLVVACYLFNKFFAHLVKTPTNVESYLITALILTLIVGPVPLLSHLPLFTFLAFVAMGSKYALVIHGRHIFNPAAAGVLASALVLGRGASWWVGGELLLPLVILGGLLVMRKIHRWHLVASFLAVYFALFTALHLGGLTYKTLILNSPLLFFAFVMLTEPLTAPQSRRGRIYYGAGIAIVLVLLQRLTGLTYSLELALLLGNLGTRLLKRDLRMALSLIKLEEIAPGIRNFWFEPADNFAWVPGQFLEWTLPHRKPDNRGVRRYFTIASAPSEPGLLLTTKFPPEKPSTYKQALLSLKPGDKVIVSHLEGEFILPSQQDSPLVFIAGGIGITPFRSIIKHLLDTNQSRQIALLYSARNEKEFVFRDLFAHAQKRFGLKPVYVVGPINEEVISKEIADFRKRIFCVSGPEPMVRAMVTTLSKMGLSRKQIKRDYFPGYTD